LRARNLLANVLSDRGDMLGALDAHRQVLQERQQLLGPDALQLAANHNNIGRTLERLERWEEALQAFANAERLLLQHGESDSIKLALVRNGMALALIGSGEPQRGEQLLRQTRERFVRDYGQEHEFVYATELGLAEASRRGGDPESALHRLNALANDTDYQPSFYFWLLRARAAADLQRWSAVTDSYRHAVDSRFVENQPFQTYLHAAIAWAQAQSTQSSLPHSQLQVALDALERHGLQATAEAQSARHWLVIKD
jgi:tetratricopeptide (TPR) repeat protein